jgi:polyisoprenoid-binding protein YceI
MTLLTRSVLVVLAAICPLAGVAAKTESFQLDPVHTRVAFQVSHAGFSSPIGTFSRTTGALDFDEKDWSSAHLDVSIPLASLELGDAKWQEKILDSTFFDAKKFPQAHFVSTRVESTGEHSAKVTGDLTMHGVTRPVTLNVTLNALKRHPLTFKRTAGFSATATLSRKDFGITAWKSVVGDEVRLIIEAEAVRGGDETSEPPTEPADADKE